MLLHKVLDGQCFSRNPVYAWLAGGAEPKGAHPGRRGLEYRVACRAGLRLLVRRQRAEGVDRRQVAVKHGKFVPFRFEFDEQHRSRTGKSLQLLGRHVPGG
jgi:hypothetical protein